MERTTDSEGPIGPLLRRVKIAAVTLVLAVTTATPTTAAALPPAPRRAGACVLPSVEDVTMSEGFPINSSTFAKATGRVRALTLFIDFPDARAEASAAQRYAEFFPAAQKWFATSSYGRLRYEPQPVLKYFTMPRKFSDYGIVRGYGWDVHERMMHDLVRVADAEVDFTAYDLVNVLVTPNAGPPATETVLSVTWTGAAADVTDDGAALDKVSVLYGHDVAKYRVLNHENGHIFGLPDLYSGFDFQATDRWAGQWDMMSLDWGMHSDFFAWHKWRLGWLDNVQVDCVTGPGVTEHTLSPVEYAGGKKLVVVPDGPTSALAVEVRAKTGNDRDGCSEGVLLYRVRTDVPTGYGPVRVIDSRPGTKACQGSSSSFNSYNDAPFHVGDLFRDQQAKVQVRVMHKHRKGAYTIRVTKG